MPQIPLGLTDSFVEGISEDIASAATLEKKAVQFLVSAGEASGDMYAAEVVSHLSRIDSTAQFYGCAGPRLQRAGVQPVVDAASLSVVGLAEVVGHLPRIYGEYRKLVRYAESHPPGAALLTDNPDFNLRVARQLKKLKVPIFYLVAPQVWAWRQGRVKTIRELVDKLYCLFPFEEAWFRERGVDATYIGHPLAHMVRKTSSREEFFERHALPRDRKMVVLLPGSRTGEVRRHLPILFETVRRLKAEFKISLVLATPKGFRATSVLQKFQEPIEALSIKVIENEAWDSIGHADLALAASGTVTIEAAILGTPMVIFYRVMPLSWHAGRRLVKAPYLSMVNLIAGRELAPELIQDNMTPDKLAAAAAGLLRETARADIMRAELAALTRSLTSEGDPLLRVANSIFENLSGAKNKVRDVVSSGRQ